MSQESDAIKARTDIVEVIEKTTGWHFTGTRLSRTRYCKEHPSLHAWPATNSYFWYSHDEGGDVFNWVKRLEKCTFDEALRRVTEGNYGSRPNFDYQPPVVPFVPLEADLHLRYHNALDASARAWWYAQGADDEAIARFFLGVCDYHPIWQQPTYTLPVIVGGKLVNVRHRMAHPPKTGDKYRPERAGLPVELFNSDILTPDLHGVIVVAGEKKAIVNWRFGLPTVSSTAGAGYWNDAWTTRLQYCRKVYIAFDPGEGQMAEKIAAQIGERSWLVDLPEKPDDFILGIERTRGQAAATAAFRDYLKQARPFVAEAWERRNAGGHSQWGKMRNLPR